MSENRAFMRTGLNDGSTIENLGKAIVAKVPQGFEGSINIRLVPGKDIKLDPDLLRGCRPRQGAQRRDMVPLELPPDTAKKLVDANKKITEWLAADKTHGRLFLERPVDALVKAGVDLSRDEQKALVRTHQAVRDEVIIPPGVTLTAINVVTHRKGRAGDQKAHPKASPSQDAGC